MSIWPTSCSSARLTFFSKCQKFCAAVAFESLAARVAWPKNSRGSSLEPEPINDRGQGWPSSDRYQAATTARATRVRIGSPKLHHVGGYSLVVFGSFKEVNCWTWGGYPKRKTPQSTATNPTRCTSIQPWNYPIIRSPTHSSNYNSSTTQFTNQQSKQHTSGQAVRSWPVSNPTKQPSNKLTKKYTCQKETKTPASCCS